MKEFDLEKAKAGAKVCTRDGREARVLCFDMKGDFPIVAIVREDGEEQIYSCCSNGRYVGSNTIDQNDLMLVGEKKEGWINIYKDGSCGKLIHTTREEAINARDVRTCLDTVHIEWEE